MKKFSTVLLREKFIIHDAGTHDPVIALSNRVVVELCGNDGIIDDVMIVRAQNMHCCARMAAKIVQSYTLSGSLVTRPEPYDWQATWETAVNDYERTYNPQLWIVIYHNGKVVFSKGDHHPFFDVIENCQASNRGEYEKAIPMAENVFRTMGKVVRINYDGNVALTLNLEPKQARIGVIVRSPLKTATFNFSVGTKSEKPLNFPQCIGAAAAFLEGIQLAFMIGMNEEKIKIGKIARHTKEEKQTQEARVRLSRLNSEIATLEGAYDVRYRPERPEFQDILTEAESLAKQTFRYRTA